MPEFLKKIISASLLIFGAAGLIFFYLYYDRLGKLGEASLTLGPILAIIAGAVIILTKNQRKLRHLRKNQEDEKSVTLNYVLSLKHDLMAWGTGFIVLIMPLLSGNKLDGGDAVSAGVVIVSMYFLKSLYWRNF